MAMKVLISMGNKMVRHPWIGRRGKGVVQTRGLRKKVKRVILASLIL